MELHLRQCDNVHPGTVQESSPNRYFCSNDYELWFDILYQHLNRAIMQGLLKPAGRGVFAAFDTHSKWHISFAKANLCVRRGLTWSYDIGFAHCILVTNCCHCFSTKLLIMPLFVTNSNRCKALNECRRPVRPNWMIPATSTHAHSLSSMKSGIHGCPFTIWSLSVYWKP